MDPDAATEAQSRADTRIRHLDTGPMQSPLKYMAET
jgi:hypothetical protein